MEEETFSYATTVSRSPPIHSPKGCTGLPSGRTRAVGSSAYFFLVTFGFLSEMPSSTSEDAWAEDEAKCRVKCSATALRAQAAMEEDGGESMYAGKWILAG